jgi:hypothetical protein
MEKHHRRCPTSPLFAGQSTGAGPLPGAEPGYAGQSAAIRQIIVQQMIVTVIFVIVCVCVCVCNITITITFSNSGPFQAHQAYIKLVVSPVSTWE